jgi:hypothetical protein
MNAIAWNALLERTREEHRNKTLAAIQYDTAYTWAARAVVAYAWGVPRDGDAYAEEAAEHAGVAELLGVVGICADVQRILKEARAHAAR